MGSWERQAALRLAGIGRRRNGGGELGGDVAEPALGGGAYGFEVREHGTDPTGGDADLILSLGPCLCARLDLFEQPGDAGLPTFLAGGHRGLRSGGSGQPGRMLRAKKVSNSGLGSRWAARQRSVRRSRARLALGMTAAAGTDYARDAGAAMAALPFFFGGGCL